VGKVIDLDLAADHADAAVERGREMCRKLLANPVTEVFEITIVSQSNGEGSEG
jgi:phosphoribosylformylglycinamidine (FGAM) synthase PurS component